MDIIFSIIRVDTFWKILLFIHFALAVALLVSTTTVSDGKIRKCSCFLCQEN